MSTPILLVYGDVGTMVAAAVESYLYRSSVDWMQCSKQAILGILSRYVQHYVVVFMPVLTANANLWFSLLVPFITVSWKRRNRRC